jgi:hypothetical protein
MEQAVEGMGDGLSGRVGPATYKDYQWIVADPQPWGGKLAIRRTRLSV